MSITLTATLRRASAGVIAVLFGVTLSAAFVPPANAATYWVSPTGSTSASGADSSSNAKTLAWFNANAVAGDICRFKSGTYTDPIQPAHDGTPGSRIRYYGFPRSPGAVTVADIKFGYSKGSYCTVKWFRCPGSISGAIMVASISTVGDSLVNCVTTNAGGGIAFQNQGSVYDSLTVTGGSITGTGQYHFIDMFMVGSGTFAKNNVVSNCNFDVTANTPASQGDVHVLGMMHTAYNTFINNTFNVTVNACFGYFFPLEMYEGYYNSFTNNRFNVQLNVTPGGTAAVWGYRDSSSYCRFVGNTVNVTGPGMISMGLSQAGSYVGTTGHMYFGNNFIKIAHPQVNGVWYYQNGARGDTCEFNVIASGAATPAFFLNQGSFTDCIYRHNTFTTAGGVVVNLSSVLDASRSRFASNVFYGGSPNGSGSSASVQVPNAPGLLDSAGVIYSVGGSAGNGIRFNGTTGVPGSGGNYGIAGRTAWGSPMFVDSTFSTLDPHLNAGSYAAGIAEGGAGAGAYPFGAAAADTVAPADVTDLTATNVSATSLLLQWHAPGDDGMSGVASVYDLRVSTSPIADLNSFNAATPLTPSPSPLSPGTLQQYAVLNLVANTNYWFAIRTRDDAGNWSRPSNVPLVTTLAVDTVPPAAIKDLSGGN